MPLVEGRSEIFPSAVALVFSRTETARGRCHSSEYSDFTLPQVDSSTLTLPHVQEPLGLITLVTPYAVVSAFEQSTTSTFPDVGMPRMG